MHGFIWVVQALANDNSLRFEFHLSLRIKYISILGYLILGCLILGSKNEKSRKSMTRKRQRSIKTEKSVKAK